MAARRQLPLPAPGDTVAVGGQGAVRGAADALTIPYERLGARVLALEEAEQAEVVLLLAPDRAALEQAERAVAPGGALVIDGPLDSEEAFLGGPQCVLSELRIEFGGGHAH